MIVESKNIFTLVNKYIRSCSDCDISFRVLAIMTARNVLSVPVGHQEDTTLCALPRSSDLS